MPEESVVVNRAPVLTLWAAVVAERQGHDREAALSLGKAVAGLNAQSKGRALGIYHAPERGPAEATARRAQADELQWVSLLGRMVPTKDAGHGVRATIEGEAIDPGGVESYLRRSFGDSLAAVEAAMRDLAASYSPEEIDSHAYGLYERFRPQIASGKRGWGQKGVLSLEQVRALAKH